MTVNEKETQGIVAGILEPVVGEVLARRAAARLWEVAKGFGLEEDLAEIALAVGLTQVWREREGADGD